MAGVEEADVTGLGSSGPDEVATLKLADDSYDFIELDKLRISVSADDEDCPDQQQQLKREGFFARPERNADGTFNLLTWDCAIPGKENAASSSCECSSRRSTRRCRFVPPLFHPNVFPSGTVCLSILDEEKDWRPSLSVKQVMLGIQELLADPNTNDPAQAEAYDIFLSDRAAFDKQDKKQVTRMRATY
ncbi:SUMO-conjugating enzyme UBC9 [Tyrophagus putrescentiae]|nr:SUMO-conjugating enzyme UBC9 [Tyrophagus putrescentiae]